MKLNQQNDRTQQQQQQLLRIPTDWRQISWLLIACIEPGKSGFQYKRL